LKCGSRPTNKRRPKKRAKKFKWLRMGTLSRLPLITNRLRKLRMAVLAFPKTFILEYLTGMV
jgi:hypothetical protein